MYRISEANFKRIAESALGVLYEKFPLPLSTTQVAAELARDNEFVLKVMLFLEKKGYAVRVGKGKLGDLSRTVKWKISKQARETYEKHLG